MTEEPSEQLGGAVPMALPPCPAGGTYGGSAIGTAPPSCSLGFSVTPPHVLP